MSVRHGNAIMVTGGLYTLTSTLLKLDGERQTPRAVAKKLFSSVPFDAYIVLLIMALCGIRCPGVVVTFTQPLANANAFLAMTMLGLMFEPPAKPEYVRQAAKLLSVRFVFAACVSALLYFFAPFDASVRAPLAIVAFAPLSALGHRSTPSGAAETSHLRASPIPCPFLSASPRPSACRYCSCKKGGTL